MPKLALISGNKSTKAFHIQDNSDILLGNSSSCGIRIDSPEIASEHIWMLCNSGRCRIIALNEKFPVLVNNKFIRDHYLSNGDELQLGNHRFCFSHDTHKITQKPKRSSARPRPCKKEITEMKPAGQDYVQVLDGNQLGRIIPLNHSLMRLGKAKGHCAVIAHRKEGYFLSHLKGPVPPTINGSPIGDSAYPLKDGNIIQIGKIRLAFHSQSH
jgi:pSer/pThr/pTyr-binding forkhead associated (FHA) protein